MTLHESEWRHIKSEGGSTMTVTTLGMDLAKGILQLRGGEGRGKVAVQKRVTHDKLLATVAQLPPCVTGMEACASAQYWAWEFQKLGHTVKLVSLALTPVSREVMHTAPQELHEGGNPYGRNTTGPGGGGRRRWPWPGSRSR